MPVVQVPLDVPDDIYKNVLNGSFELLGMVKDSHNRVRKHIPKANIPKADNVKKEGVLEIVKKNKVVVALAFAAVAVAGAHAYNSWKEHKIKAATEERIGEFQKAFNEYVKASKKCELNTKVVENLLIELDELEEKKLGKDIKLTISASQLTELIFSIFTYTESLAKANDYDVKVAKPRSGTKGNIVSLKSYLEIQKDILEKSA